MALAPVGYIYHRPAPLGLISPFAFFIEVRKIGSSEERERKVTQSGEWVRDETVKGEDRNELLV